MRYKITIEYDGTNLLGWQRQLDGPSVQEYLENALSSFVPKQEKFLIQGAGRTDAGVHATHQVAHFDLDKAMDSFRLKEAFNFHLRMANAPVAILDVQQVSDDFHARFSACGRGYIYRILNRKAPPVLDKNRVWWVYVALDVAKMREAAQYLLGHHDFSSFRAAQCQALSPMKTLDRLDIDVIGEEIVFTVEARSFLHHQVRTMVGTLKMVGEGYFQPIDILKIFEAKNRAAAGANAPAYGLYLNKVIY